MNCEKYLISIDDLIENELDTREFEQVNLHIQKCLSCASYYETLKQEKEIYAQYLFNAEPSNDLWNKVLAEIKPAQVLQNNEKPIESSVWNFNLFRSFRLYPILGFAVLLIVCAVALIKLVPNKTDFEDEYAAAETNLNINREIPAQSTEIDKSKPQSEAKQADINKKYLAKATEPVRKTGSLQKKFNSENIHRIALKQTKAKEKTVSKDNKNLPLQANVQLSEEQLQFKFLQEETAKQVEKIELLLRSFRNARIIEKSNVYDVAYEKQQARKLLEKNFQLRQATESYGTLYTEELLDKAEPFLLDIANLENNPLPEKVLDIKERVKNQNIIASLQVY